MSAFFSDNGSLSYNFLSYIQKNNCENTQILFWDSSKSMNFWCKNALFIKEQKFYGYDENDWYAPYDASVNESESVTATHGSKFKKNSYNSVLDRL